MPICPRCGKCLSSEQALAYHLNKRYKCGTWKCLKCKTGFDSKFQLQLHEFNCIENREETPSFDILRQLYLNLPLLIFKVTNNKIEEISPACRDFLGFNPQEMIGNEIIKAVGNDSKWVTKTHEIVNVHRTEVKHMPGFYIDRILT
jgi:hypothetical protein